MNKLVFIIGKNPNVSNNEIGIPLTDPKDEISNSHCKITFDGINYVLENLSTESNIFVNNREVLGKTIVTGDDKISLGTNYKFSLLHPLIQSWVNKTFFDDNQKNNPIYKKVEPIIEKFKMLMTKKEALNAAFLLGLSVFIDIYVLFINTNTKKGEMREAFLDFASIGLFLVAFNVLSKFFKSYKKKGIVSLIKTVIIIGWIYNVVGLLLTFIGFSNGKNSEMILGYVFIGFLVLTFISLIIDIILNVKFIGFDEDETNILRPYGIISIIVSVTSFFVMIFEFINDSDSNLPITTIIEIIPSILLIVFFVKVTQKYKMIND